MQSGLAFLPQCYISLSVILATSSLSAYLHSSITVAFLSAGTSLAILLRHLSSTSCFICRTAVYWMFLVFHTILFGLVCEISDVSVSASLSGLKKHDMDKVTAITSHDVNILDLYIHIHSIT